MDITITLTDAEVKAMEYAAASPQEWIENAIKNRANIATQDITKIVVDHCLANSLSIPNTVEGIIDLGFSEKVIERVKDRPAPPSSAVTP